MILFNASSLLLLALAPAAEPEANQTQSALPPIEPSAALATAQDAGDEPKWTGSVNLGAIVNSGNTNNTAVAASLDAELKREKDRHSIGLYWNYAANETPAPGAGAGSPDITTVTDRRVGGNYQYDYFVNDKTYYLANAGANDDKLALLHLRWYAGVGIGHQFKDTEDFKFKGEAGLVYLEENFVDPFPPAQSSDSEGISARLAYDLEKKISDTTTFEQHTEVFPSLKDIDNTYARVDSRLKIKMTENMNAQLQWILQWDNTPAPGQVSVDNQFIASLGWGF